MKKIFLLLLFISMSILASDPKLRTGNFPDKEMKTQNIEVARLVAEEITSTLPQTVDKYTTLVSVKNEDSTLVYTFLINTGVKSDEAVKKEDHTRMKKAITTGICQSSEKFLAAGINTSYIYKSAKTKVHLFQFDVSQDDCLTSLN